MTLELAVEGGREMKERPILFSGPMVRAILEGRKTQTRRVVKLPRVKGLEFRFDGAWKDGGLESPFQAGEYLHMPFRCIADGDDGWRAESFERLVCPFGVPGDRLWVRETWNWGLIEADSQEAFGAPKMPIPKEKPFNSYVSYCADDEDGPWKPSIHMPRWASRITLEISGVRVERLQDISEEDAKAEGAEFRDFGKHGFGQQKDGWSMDILSNCLPTKCLSSARMAFANYINTLHGGENWNFYYSWPAKYRCPLWDQNPWVWVVEFRVVKAKEGAK